MAETGKIAVGDWNMLDYFWSAKGDLERWTEWERFAAERPNHPVVRAWDDYKRSCETLSMLIKGCQP